MKEVRVSEKTIDFLSEFMTRINTQDNRATASPYYYVIRTPKWRAAHEDFTNGETRTCRVDWEGDPTVFYSKEEFIKWAKDYYDGEPDTDVDEKWEKLDEFTEEKYFEEDGCFLTEEAANGHLALHRYHYHDDSYVYLKHAFRNPELMKLLDAIGELTGVGHKRR